MSQSDAMPEISWQLAIATSAPISPICLPIPACYRAYISKVSHWSRESKQSYSCLLPVV